MNLAPADTFQEKKKTACGKLLRYGIVGFGLQNETKLR